MKRIIVLLLLLLLTFTGMSCQTKEEKEEKFEIKVIDIDGEIIADKFIDSNKYKNLTEVLENEFDSNIVKDTYGSYLKSINGSVIDNNWSLMTYINGSEATTSIDNTFPTANDLIEIKNTCWASIDYGFGTTYDEFDVLLDKALYHYIKTSLKQTCESLDTYTNSSMWEMMFINLYKSAGLDTSLVNFKYKQELIDSIKNTDINTLQDASIGKYYLHARELNIIDPNFNTFYQNVLDNLEGKTFNDYVSPFVILPAYGLDVDKSVFDTFLTDVTGSLEWGPCGNVWKAVSISLFKDIKTSINLDDYMIDWSIAYQYGSNSDLCNVLLLTSALGIDAREYKINYNGTYLDYLAFILTKYMDTNTNLVKSYETDNDFVMSSNQIYLALLAYKVYKLKGEANIFK